MSILITATFDRLPYQFHQVLIVYLYIQRDIHTVNPFVKQNLRDYSHRDVTIFGSSKQVHVIAVQQHFVIDSFMAVLSNIFGKFA